MFKHSYSHDIKLLSSLFLLHLSPHDSVQLFPRSNTHHQIATTPSPPVGARRLERTSRLSRCPAWITRDCSSPRRSQLPRRCSRPWQLDLMTGVIVESFSSRQSGSALIIGVPALCPKVNVSQTGRAARLVDSQVFPWENNAGKLSRRLPFHTCGRGIDTSARVQKWSTCVTPAEGANRSRHAPLTICQNQLYSFKTSQASTCWYSFISAPACLGIYSRNEAAYFRHYSLHVRHILSPFWISCYFSHCCVVGISSPIIIACQRRAPTANFDWAI